MKKLMREFREFALKSDVLNLAIAVIMGGAAGKMVSSLVDSVLMPIIGIFLGGKDFSSLSIQIGDASIMYGAFIQSIVDFFIISVCVFLLVKGMNSLNKKVLHHEDKKEKEEEKEKLLSTEEYLKEIKELLEKDTQKSS